MNDFSIEAAVAPAVAVLPLNRRNVLTGAGFTALIFPQLIAITFTVAVVASTGLDSRGALFGAYTYVVAAIVAALVALVAVPVLGVPLSIAAGRILRENPSVVVNLIGQFVAGGIAAGIVLVIMAILDIEGVLMEGVAFTLAIIAATGVSAALGWWLALRVFRRRQRMLDSQFEEPDAYRG